MTDGEWMTKLRSMLDEYERATHERHMTPSDVPVRLHIADDIVSQAVKPLLAEVDRLRAKNAALREIAEAVMKDAPTDQVYIYSGPVSPIIQTLPPLKS